MTIRIAALTSAALLALSLSAGAAFASAGVTTKPVHVLAGPATTFASLLDLAENSKVGILWCGPASFDWCLIQFHRKQGWVHVADLLTLDANGSPIDGPNKNGPAGPNGPNGPQGNPNVAPPLNYAGPGTDNTVKPTPVIVKNLGL